MFRISATAGSAVRVRTSVAVLSFVAAMLLAAMPATAQEQRPANWTDTITPFRVIDDVYYVGSAGLSAWLITTPKGHILLDVGLPQNAALVERNIRTLGFQLADVKILLNTHAHDDHAGGLAQLRRSTGARLYAMAGDRRALERGVYAGSEGQRSLRFPPVPVDSVLRDSSTVTLGGVTLMAHNTRGHTAGCTTWTMPVRHNGGKHSVAFFCSASVAANRLAPRPQYPGIVTDYPRTFARLKALNADVMLAPHAEQFDLRAKRAKLAAGQANPFIVPGELAALAAAMEETFVNELRRQRGKK